MVKLNKVDKIFEDLLDLNFLIVFKPIFFMQRVFGVLGVNIEYRFITPPRNMYKVYSCVLWLVNSICIVDTVAHCSTRFHYLSTDLPLKVGTVLNGVVNVGLAWKNVFYSGYANSQLYVKLQRIERSLKMKNAKHLNRKLYMMSLIAAIISVSLFILWIFVFHKYLTRDFCPSATLASVVSSAGNFQIYHIFIIFYFLSLRVQYVNDILMQAHIAQKGNVYSTSDVVAASNDKITKDLVHGMYYVLDSFADTMEIFQHAIFFFTFQMLAWQLITMQNLVISFKMQMSVDIYSFLCTLPCSLTFMVLMLMLCSISQSLTSKLAACEEYCAALTSSLDEGESRQNAKRITLLVRAKRNATVFDIFTLNTRLPLHLLAVTASYTIVLLQFAAL